MVNAHSQLILIGHGNRDHATSSKRWLRQLSSKTLQAPSFGGVFVIPITVPYSTKCKISAEVKDRENVEIFTVFKMMK